jgi:hypothetical protein
MARGGWRLSAAQRRIWERSNAITTIRVPPSPRLNLLATHLATTLESGDRARVQTASQAVLDAYCGLLRVPHLQVEVEGTRPTNHYGELHGLYRPGNGRVHDRVQVWMYTARRGQVVAFKTFLRTLLHELGHHLDYEYLKLPGSLHTEGFYRRENSLFYAAMPRPTAGPAARNLS